MLRIAVPNKGSLAESSIAILKEAGYRQRSDSRDLILLDSDNGVEFYDLNKQLGIIELPKKTKEETAVFPETTETEYFTNDIPSNFVLNGGE